MKRSYSLVVCALEKFGKPEGSEPATVRSRWGGRTAVAVAALLVVGALITAGVLGAKLQQSNEVDDAARAAEQAARSYVVTLTTVDAGKLNENFAAVLDGLGVTYRVVRDPVPIFHSFSRPVRLEEVAGFRGDDAPGRRGGPGGEE